MENISPALLHWFHANHRILPFRSDPTPYHVWLSEIMLQQTRVSAALPYYERFLAALPDIPALAACEEEKLHKLWEGLGYYSRVRNLQKAAKLVCPVCTTTTASSPTPRSSGHSRPVSWNTSPRLPPATTIRP